MNHLIEVSKDQFFAYVNPRDIITSAEGRSNDERGIFSIFTTRQREEVGRIYNKPTKVYMLQASIANP